MIECMMFFYIPTCSLYRRDGHVDYTAVWVLYVIATDRLAVFCIHRRAYESPLRSKCKKKRKKKHLDDCTRGSIRPFVDPDAYSVRLYIYCIHL